MKPHWSTSKLNRWLNKHNAARQLQWCLVPDSPETSSLRLEAHRKKYDLLFYLKLNSLSGHRLFLIDNVHIAESKAPFLGAIGGWRGFSFFLNNFTLKTTCRLLVLETHRQNSLDATCDSPQKEEILRTVINGPAWVSVLEVSGTSQWFVGVSVLSIALLVLWQGSKQRHTQRTYLTRYSSSLPPSISIHCCLS